MTGYRKIIHIDLDAFFCAVEILNNPELEGIPFAVGGRPEERGVVASCSYPARKFGVRSAMPMARALRLCPGLLIVSSRHGVYGKISSQVMEILNDLTPLVEQVSIDEAFFDVSDLPTSPRQIAQELQARIREQLHLPCSLGVATNKLVAKIANDVGKSTSTSSGPPNAITVVPPGDEADFLAPLPLEALWGVGPKTAARLAELGIQTIGDLANHPQGDLIRICGKSAYDLAQRARGIDDHPIQTSHEIKSISRETTFSVDINDRQKLEETLKLLSGSVGRRLRRSHLVGATVKIKLRWSDFTTFTRQTTLDQPTDQDFEILTAANQLFTSAWHTGQKVRLIGVGVSGLGPPVRQLSFWDGHYQKERQIQSLVDQLRERFGEDVVQWGNWQPSPRKSGK